MLKRLQCILLISGVLSISLFGEQNIGMTKEIENRREGVVYTVDTPAYTDGFWMEEDETVYLLQSYKSSILELSRRGMREILLSEALLPADVICDEQNIYIFDDLLSELQIYTKQGELLLRSKIDVKNDYVKGLKKTEDGVAVLTFNNTCIFVNPETGKQKKVKEEAVPEVDKAEYDYAEYLATDEEENVYSVHTNIVQDCSVLSGELTLRVVSEEGIYLGGYVLPVEEYLYLPGTYIQVLSNGNIYILVPEKECIEIRKIAITEYPESNLDAISDAAFEKENAYAAETRYRKKIGTACTEKVKLSREKVWQRAEKMANYQWTLKKTHTQTSKSEKGVELPREIAAAKAKHAGLESWSVKMTGIPYCWGGFHALDVGVNNRTFSNALNKNFVAGNINPDGYYKYMTTGLDCSGYVSAAFGFKEKLSTKGLSDMGSKISDARKMEKMDLLLYPGDHAIFFVEWMNDTTMLVAESAAREGKVVIHPKSLNELVVNGRYQMRSPW